MSTTLNHVTLLTPTATPYNARGARIASQLFAAAYRAVAQFFSAPAPKTRSAVEEAEEIRALAWRVRNSDPGFSADLYAAAARHEGLLP